MPPGLHALAQRIMDSYGASTGCDGEPGVSPAALAQFFADVQAVADWHGQAPAQSCGLASPAQALAAAQALMAVQAKVEDFFARCRLAAFDATALQPLSPSAEGYALLGKEALHAGDRAVAALPLAAIHADALLPLAQGLNPAWVDAMAVFQAQVVTPLLGGANAIELAPMAAAVRHPGPLPSLAGRPAQHTGGHHARGRSARLAGQWRSAALARLDGAG